MKEYHKINSIFKRDEKTHRFTKEFAQPEFEYLQNNKWMFTEKVDGTNIRVHWTGDRIVFGGRSDAANIPPNLQAKLGELFGGVEMGEILKTMFEKEATFYGEGYGAKIQKAGASYIPDGVSFVLFDVRIGEYWLQRFNVEEIAKTLGLKHVPVIGSGTIAEAIELVKSNPKSTWGDFQMEGLVIRPEVEILTRGGHRIISKVKCIDFK
jgi:ATP-dependent RNA circularization protein (DNA/RNA ligase family)